MIKVGLPSYLNALPFRMWFEQDPNIELICDVPTSINQKFKRGELDVALISSREAIGHNYTLLPYGIAAEKEILSVNLYQKESLSTLDQVLVGLTSESSTSASLVKVLSTHFWKVTPHFETSVEGKEYDAFLLIGDSALNRLDIEGFKRIDLATSWHEMTSLPFVFALFATHEEISLTFPQFQIKDVLKRASTLSSLPTSLLTRYYSLCRYSLDKCEWEGFSLFSKLLCST